METITVTASALREVLSTFNVPPHVRLQMIEDFNARGESGPVKILVAQYNEQVAKDYGVSLNGDDIFDEYVKFTRTTAIYPKSQENENTTSFMYLALGLVSEIAELSAYDKVFYIDSIPAMEQGKRMSAGHVDEIGDVLWYVARICDTFGYDFAEMMRAANKDAEYEIRNVVSSENPFNKKIMPNLLSQAGLVANSAKKAHRDGDFIPITGQLKQIVFSCVIMLILNGKNATSVIVRNMEKLSSRKERGVLGGSGDER